MVNIQEIFDRLRETKKKQKDIKRTYKDALEGSQEYQEVLEKLKQLREKKKQIEKMIQSDFSGELNKLDEYKIDVQSDNMLLTDAAISKMMKGESIDIKDEYENKYEPVFSVKFKKAS